MNSRKFLDGAGYAGFAVILAVISFGCAAQRGSAEGEVAPSQILDHSPDDASSIFERSLAALNFDNFAATLSQRQIDAALGDALQGQSGSQRRAAASLLAMGAIEVDDLLASRRVHTTAKIQQFVEITNNGHPALAGRVGDIGLLARLSQPLNYDSLLSATDEITALGEALNAGVITGYDLRAPGIYDNFPPGQTFIYSHSDLLHLRQLVTLMRQEQLNAWVYVTPKVSAFLYREGWGGAASNVITTASGVRVVQGREMAVLFRFDSAQDRLRFRNLVTRYAKRDSDDESGLIASAWWQPFYYSDQSVPNFQPISLVVLSNRRIEATLTVLEPKSEAVVAAVKSGPWQLRKDKVWVNPAFHRFLNGDFK